MLSIAYSYEMGALSSNNEIKKAVQKVKSHIGERGCWVFDRGADNEILKDFFIGECPRAIIRLKKNTRVDHEQEKVEVRELGKKIDFSISQKVVKVKKDRPVAEVYDIGAVPIEYW